MKSQKQAVVDEIKTILGARYSPSINTLTVLTSIELETVKGNITDLISQGVVDYSKDRSNFGEVRAYARSMVMNHVKKAKELNGGLSQNNNTSDKTTTVKYDKNLAPKGVDVSVLPDYMKEYVKGLRV